MTTKGQENLKGRGPEAARRGGGRFVRYCFVLLLLGVVILAWISLLTYSRTDPPSTEVFPPKHPVDNWAGVVGAYVAYALRYWLGSGVYMGLLFATVAAVILMTGGRISDLPWRLIGILLLIASTSSAVYLLNPAAADDLNSGAAGILGISAGRLLASRFAQVGAWLIVVIALLIGLLLAADNLVLQLPRFGKKVWDHRGDFQTVVNSLRPGGPRPVTAGARDITASPREIAAVTAAPNKPVVKARPAAGLAETPASPGRLPPGARDAARAPKGPQAPAGQVPLQLRPKPAPMQAPQPRPAQARPPEAAPARPAEPRPPLLKSDRPGSPGDKGPATQAQGYVMPPRELLAKPSGGYIQSQELQAQQNAIVLQQTLNDFNVAAQIIAHMTGPVITMFELSLAPGVKVAQVANLANDIARALAVPGVRIVSPIPGKDTIGVEVPNLDKEIVRIKELMDMAPEAEGKMQVPLYLGKDAAGAAIVADLGTMPHILIAGTTGSGKSVCINSIVSSILLTRTPEQVRLIMCDPKMVEMAAFENIPHLLCPIVNDMRKAEEILDWAATKMDERYELLKEAGVKNIVGFNRLPREEIYQRFGVDSEEERANVPTRLPYYVIIIDELADLMMTSGKEVEGYVIRIAQKARAVGIHLVLATQRPSVNVVTGLIKSNMPCRISFRVASRQESRIVLDQNGADVLLGEGDMLFLQPGTSSLIRAQGTYVDDAEIRTIVNAVRANTAQPQYNAELLRLNSHASGENGGERDELFDQAVEIVLTSQRGSVSLLQRRLQIGYSRSSRIIDQMADAGVLGDYKGSQARECLVTLEEWQDLKASVAADQSGESSADGEPTSS